MATCFKAWALLRTGVALCWPLVATLAQADTGKLLLTGGVSSLDGAAGGGISPWAVIGTQATQGQWGVSAFASRASTQDYGLSVAGAAFAWDERVELSLARQNLNTGPTGTALGLPGLHLKQNIYGAKFRLAGDAVLDSDSLMPQIAVGALHKQLDSSGLNGTLQALGAKRSGTDFYLSATKLFLAQGVLLNATLRATKANQTGLLGFGSARNSGYALRPELSGAVLLSRNLAVGAEYRAKPDKLNQILGAGVLQEDAWADVFVAWAPSKNFSLTAAYVDLGRIAPPFAARRQTGWYLSGQAAF
jgi:hypothetical protein